MKQRKALPLSPRKSPLQARSQHLVGAILQAAIRVLERDGAAAFTTVRVAAMAGVSVGSLYQYFPNKEAILFRLQTDEWEATSRLLVGIFTDQRLQPAERLRAAMVAFFQTERDEAPLRRALGAAVPLYEAHVGQDHFEQGRKLLAGLIAEVAPGLPSKRRAFATELYVSLLTAMGEHVSETTQSRAAVARFATAIADMFLAYVAPPTRPSRPRRR